MAWLFWRVVTAATARLSVFALIVIVQIGRVSDVGIVRLHLLLLHLLLLLHHLGLTPHGIDGEGTTRRHMKERTDRLPTERALRRVLDVLEDAVRAHGHIGVNAVGIACRLDLGAQRLGVHADAALEHTLAHRLLGLAAIGLAATSGAEVGTFGWKRQPSAVHMGCVRAIVANDEDAPDVADGARLSRSL
eukprot:7381786-Prymnesium_polylepis.1